MSDTVVSENASENILKTVKFDDCEFKVLNYNVSDLTPYIVAGKYDTNSVGSSSCPLSISVDGEETPIYYITPRMRCPFGLNINGDKPENRSYKVACSITGHNNPDHPAYHKANEYTTTLQAIDTAVKDLAFKNSVLWLKQENTGDDEEFMEIVSGLFNDSFKLSVDKAQIADGKYPPTQTLSFLYYNNVFNTEAYDQAGNRLDILTSIVKGCSIKALVRVQKVTFPSGSFGVRHVIERLKIWPPKQGESSGARNVYSIQDSDDESDD